MTGAVTKAVKIGGQDHLLTFGFEAMYAAEQEIGRGFFAIMGGGLQSAVEQRELFRAVLAPGSVVSSEEAMKLINQAGPKQVVEWLVDGLNEYLGEPKAQLEMADAAADKRAKRKA